MISIYGLEAYLRLIGAIPPIARPDVRRTDPPEPRTSHADQGVVRILSAEDAGNGGDAVEFDRAARTACAEFCLRHLRRGRIHARAHTLYNCAHPERDEAEARGTSHLRCGDDERDRSGRERLLGRGG